MRRKLPPNQIQLRFASDPRLLCVARASVRRFVQLAGFDGKRAEAIVLAVDESLTNVIRHCYGGRTTELIELALRLESASPARLLVSICDEGPPIEAALLAPPQDKDMEEPGGLGLRLIHEVMDSVELRRSDTGGNELLLTVTVSAE